MGYKYNPFTGQFDRVEAGTVLPDVETLTGDSGGAIGPDGAFNINLLGDSAQGTQTSGAGNTITFTNLNATISQKGVQELATDAEAIAGSDTVRSIVPSALEAKLGVLTPDSVPFGQGTGSAIGWTSALTDGQIVIGSTAGSPAVSTITAGTGIAVTNAANSITLDASGSTPLSFPTDSGTATPAANALTVTGGTGINTSGAAAAVTINLDSPVLVANGGTGATSFTQGSVIFMGAAAFSQDNSNFFWDDTNNRLGIGTTTPLDDLEVVGSADIIHTAVENDEHAFEIDCNCAGFTDVKALDIVYISGAVAAGEEEEGILINIDETASVGGFIKGYEILATAEGSAVIYGYTTGINVAPVLHNSGTFGNADDILNIAVDVTAALASGGAGNISAFVADNDTMTIGDAAQFGEMEWILDTPSSGAGISPTFEYSTGGVGFSAFSPSDGTNGMRNSGAILWEPTDLAGWIANATGFLEVRITRTRNSLSTTPIIDEVQISATTEFIWDKDGDVNLNSLLLATDLAVAEGGTGRSSATAYAVICGGTTSTAAQQSIASVGTSGQILTSNGAAALPTFQAAAGGGALVQQVRSLITTKTQYTTIAAIPRDTSIPQNDEGVEVATLSITPTNSNNILWIQANFTGAVDSTTNNNLEIALFQDSDADALETQTYDLRAASQEGCVYFYFSYFMVAGTTDATTFDFRMGGQNLATITVNGVADVALYGGTMGSVITITEITV